MNGARIGFLRMRMGGESTDPGAFSPPCGEGLVVEVGVAAQAAVPGSVGHPGVGEVLEDDVGRFDSLLRRLPIGKDR